MGSLEGVHLSTGAGAVRVVISPAHAALRQHFNGNVKFDY